MTLNTMKQSRSLEPRSSPSSFGPLAALDQDDKATRTNSPQKQPAARNMTLPFKYTFTDVKGLGISTPGDILTWTTSTAVLIPLRAFKDLVITKPANQALIIQLKRYTELFADIADMTPAEIADLTRPWSRFRLAIIARTLHNLSDRTALGPAVVGAVPGLDNDALRGEARAALAFPWIKTLEQILTNSYLGRLLPLNNGASSIWDRAARAAFEIMDATVHDLYPDLGRVGAASAT